MFKNTYNKENVRDGDVAQWYQGRLNLGEVWDS
jgi:hypothetical protein